MRKEFGVGSGGCVGRAALWLAALTFPTPSASAGECEDRVHESMAALDALQAPLRAASSRGDGASLAEVRRVLDEQEGLMIAVMRLSWGCPQPDLTPVFRGAATSLVNSWILRRDLAAEYGIDLSTYLYVPGILEQHAAGLEHERGRLEGELGLRLPEATAGLTSEVLCATRWYDAALEVARWAEGAQVFACQAVVGDARVVAIATALQEWQPGDAAAGFARLDALYRSDPASTKRSLRKYLAARLEANCAAVANDATTSGAPSWLLPYLLEVARLYPSERADAVARRECVRALVDARRGR